MDLIFNSATLSNCLVPGMYVRHYKGQIYRILHKATNKSDNDEDVIVYQDASGGEIYTRNACEFDEMAYDKEDKSYLGPKFEITTI